MHTINHLLCNKRCPIYLAITQDVQNMLPVTQDVQNTATVMHHVQTVHVDTKKQALLSTSVLNNCTINIYSNLPDCSIRKLVCFSYNHKYLPLSIS